MQQQCHPLAALVKQRLKQRSASPGEAAGSRLRSHKPSPARIIVCGSKPKQANNSHSEKAANHQAAGKNVI
jgi:hypothetical protein